MWRALLLRCLDHQELRRRTRKVTSVAPTISAEVVSASEYFFNKYFTHQKARDGGLFRQLHRRSAAESNKIVRERMYSLSELFATKMRFVGHTLVFVELYENGKEENECMLNVYTNSEEEGIQPLHMYGIDVILPLEAYSGTAREIRSWAVWVDMRRFYKQLLELGVCAKSIILTQHVGWAEREESRRSLTKREIETVKF